MGTFEFCAFKDVNCVCVSNHSLVHVPGVHCYVRASSTKGSVRAHGTV